MPGLVLRTAGCREKKTWPGFGFPCQNIPNPEGPLCGELTHVPTVTSDPCTDEKATEGGMFLHTTQTYKAFYLLSCSVIVMCVNVCMIHCCTGCCPSSLPVSHEEIVCVCVFQHYFLSSCRNSSTRTDTTTHTAFAASDATAPWRTSRSPARETR